MRYCIIFLIFLTFNTDCFFAKAQNEGDIVKMTDILMQAADSSNEEMDIVVVNAFISFDNIPKAKELIPGMNITIEREMPIIEYIISQKDSSAYSFDKDGRIRIFAQITFENCVFQQYKYSDFRFEKGMFLYSPESETSLSLTQEPNLFSFVNCVFNGLQIVGANVNYSIAFYGSEIHDLNIWNPPSLAFYSNIIETGAIREINNPDGTIVFSNNTFVTEIERPNHVLSLDTILDVNVNFDRAATLNAISLLGRENDLVSSSGKIGAIDFFENRLVPLDGNQRKTNITIANIEFGNLSLVDNVFDGDFNLLRSKISQNVEIANNHFNEKFSLTRTSLSEQMNIIPWDQIGDRRLYYRGDLMAIDNPNLYQLNNYISYYGESDIELANDLNFESLIASYRSFFEVYKVRGDLASANACYAEMKDLQLRKLAHSYRSSKGLKNWLQWRLSQLMKVYTEHGTDPAKAVLISLYLLIGFAVFYFFFPSEWDVTDKNELTKNIRDSFSKKNPNRSRSLFRWVGLLFLSFLNAITLSLNSFITLGFGAIPTTGLARYVCVVQGFIGWFLLSLFSVALINQVLF